MTSAGPFAGRNVVKRTITAACGVAFFVLITYIGLPAFLLSALVVQVKCFHEIIAIAYASKKVPEIPSFRLLNWYFVIVANYFFCGETFPQYLVAFTTKYEFFAALFKYHRVLSFCCYFLGLVWFTNLLKREATRQQFSLLAWTHFLCIIIVFQSYTVVQNTFEGLVWLIVPISIVFLNDIFAYLFGKLFGKTPLTELSPSKTIEGFLGGALGTVVLGSLLAHLLSSAEYLVCPTKFILTDDRIVMSNNCTPSYLFQLEAYRLGPFRLETYPFLWHVQVISLFASLVAPFGGFCASGFKRGFKVKDFADTFPGHGGFMDRFDGQYLMATFINVYISTFIKSSSSIDKILVRVSHLSNDNQRIFFNLLEESLRWRGLLS
ncbi:phosphatidate cytidylyltransferase, photoreceptor-specific-like [Cylas formicarius]|uniref:phosphatidate cytidylyltransferase, photoreceptor-specific-like n=1 Tax=Cylas formicarius TaxID=197179 RepID=UPI00295840DE|nr:phosphatidate cytidylyltransferase, photoreceptor-specific-like [Cylas formicarius]XP_060517483.1 phosphatidate cytidylyltransferase, photoreceptor-specific-like [Cylas formicarius]